MKYRFYKRKIFKRLNTASQTCRGSLCSLTFKILPISIIALISVALFYVSLVSIIVINNFSKISLGKQNTALQSEITDLEIAILNKRQTLNKDAILAMDFKETTNIKYIETNKTVTTLLGNR